MKKETKIYKDFFNTLIQYNDFLITTHINPDGDAISSIILMGYILSKLDKKYKIILNSSIQENFKFLVNKHYNILVPELLIVGDDVDLLTQFPEDYFPKAILILDACGKERLAEYKKYFNKADAIFNIDHHLGKRGFKGKIDIVDDSASSTGEVIYDILKVNNFDIDLTIAELAYIAIVNDTRFFTQPNTTENTHLIAAECLKLGVNPESVYQDFSGIHIETLKTFGKVLSRLKKENNMVWSYITKKEIEETPDNDLDGLIEKLRDVKNIDAAVLFKELDVNKIKVSLRGKNGFDVFKIANKYGGGGHKQAAGCTLYKTMDETVKIILKEF